MRKRALVIDDDIALLHMLRDLLSAYDVDTAPNAEYALDLLWNTSYDVIVSDIVMPGLSGRGFHEVLERYFPQLLKRVIYVTGNTSDPRTVEFVVRKSVRVITKPFDISRFLSDVAEVADS